MVALPVSSAVVTPWLDAQGVHGTVEDPKTLVGVADNIAGRTICAFGEACAWPTQSFIQKFRDEFTARAVKPEPPPMPPEYTPDELINNAVVPTIPGPRDTGREIMGPAATR